MKILLKYFLKEFSRYYVIILLATTAMLLVAEFFDKMEEFYSHKASSYLALQYLLLQAPKSLLFVSPVASLLSILFTVGIASKWKETVAIRAAGGSLKKLFSSFLILGIVISIVTLLIGETLSPMATRKAALIRTTKILKRSPKIIYREGALWVKGLDRSLIRIKDFVEDKDKVLKISIFNFDPSFRLTKRIEADEAEWLNGGWTLKNVSIFDMTDQKNIRHKALVFNALEEPKIFREEMKKSDEMDFYELYVYYKRLENAGFKNLRYIVDLYTKLAYPTVNFVMIVFGVALALNLKSGGGMRSAGLGLMVIIAYWMIFSVSLSLGNTGVILPQLAPWISPVLFGSVGCYMFLKIRE